MPNEMTDAELSLAVARAMWPEYKWKVNEKSVYRHWLELPPVFFNHTTDDALGKMSGFVAGKGLELIKSDYLAGCEMLDTLLYALAAHDNRAIAEQIVGMK